MLLRIIILIATFINHSNVYANPAPINLELDKATLQDIKNSYRILSQKNPIFGGKEYFLDTESIEIQGLKEVSVICDENEIVQGVQLILNKDKFNDIYQSLAKKYKLNNETIPAVGNKIATFVDGDCQITVTAQHMSFNMYVFYLTNAMAQKISSTYDKEDEKKKAKEEQAL